MADPGAVVISAAELARRLEGAAAPLVVDLSKPEAYARGHVPGAVSLAYADLVRSEPPVGGLLPAADALCTRLSRLGLSAGRAVAAYDDEGNGRAGRLVWTLHVLGHPQAAILDGGLAAWQRQGGAVASEAASTRARDYHACAGAEAVADKRYILRRLGDPDLCLVDTRAPAEYRGEELRAARGGHIPGAVSFDWVRAMELAHHRRLRPAQEIRAELAALGVTADREVVVYCQTHHRSSHTYVVLKHLGFERVRGYPGAWSDWGNDPATPVALGPDP